MDAIVETRDLTKKFGDFTANDRISMKVSKGEIRAIIGENGAGKSTLMNMLYGIFSPTSGQILLRGEPIGLKSPKDAIGHGIGMVHQHFKLAPSLTVYENIVLGVETTRVHKLGSHAFKGLLIDDKMEKKAVLALIDQFNFNLDINAKVKDISIGAKQRVEILKMLYRDVDVLILNEPTAVLIPQEVDELMDRLQSLKKAGKTIIIITHKLNEVKMCADTISVIRAGRLIDTVVNDDAATNELLAEMMVGRTVLMRVNKSGKPAGEAVRVSVRALTCVNSEGKTLLNRVSFDIHENEVLGIAGVEGNGQSELMFALTGLMNIQSGSVRIDGEDVTGLWPDRLREKSVGIVPEDRYRQGLCLRVPLSNNLVAGYHGKQPYCAHGLMNYGAICEKRKELVTAYDIRLSDREDPLVGSLSGGNAQKVIIAREFSRKPKVLLISQPTRGVDIGAIEFIHNQVLRLRDQGTAVLVISSDLSEVASLSDRLLVMYQGEIVGEFNSADVDFKELGLYMSGASRMDAPDGAKEVIAVG